MSLTVQQIIAKVNKQHKFKNIIPQRGYSQQNNPLNDQRMHHYKQPTINQYQQQKLKQKQTLYQNNEQVRNRSIQQIKHTIKCIPDIIQNGQYIQRLQKQYKKLCQNYINLNKQFKKQIKQTQKYKEYQDKLKKSLQQNNKLQKQLDKIRDYQRKLTQGSRLYQEKSISNVSRDKNLRTDRIDNISRDNRSRDNRSIDNRSRDNRSRDKQKRSSPQRRQKIYATSDSQQVVKYRKSLINKNENLQKSDNSQYQQEKTIHFIDNTTKMIQKYKQSVVQKLNSIKKLSLINSQQLQLLNHYQKMSLQGNYQQAEYFNYQQSKCNQKQTQKQSQKNIAGTIVKTKVSKQANQTIRKFNHNYNRI